MSQKYILISSLINMTSGLLILKKKKKSTLHVYWFLRFFPPLTLVYCSYAAIFSKKNPTLYVYSNLHIYWFCNFCTYPSCLFQPPRLSREMRVHTVVCQIDVHARLLIMRKKSHLHNLILVCTFIVFVKRFPLHVYYILQVY